VGEGDYRSLTQDAQTCMQAGRQAGRGIEKKEREGKVQSLSPELSESENQQD